MRRTVASLGLALLAAGTISACNVTSQTTSCSDGLCTVELSGASASAELELNSTGEAFTVELAGADGSTADLLVNGESGSCSADDDLTIASIPLSCTEVGDDAVTVVVG